MQFLRDEQIKQLDQMLDGKDVKSRKQGGSNVAYLDGYTIIRNANKVFGFGGWQGQIKTLEQAEHSTYTKDGREGLRVGYTCVYELTVFGEDGSFRIYTDVGFGTGTSYQSASDAIESATKEAVTDAMKRCFRLLGNQFGLALYDKERAQVDNGNFNPDEARKKLFDLPAVTLDDVRKAMKIESRDEFKELYKEVSSRGTQTQEQ
jgi:DNA repair and recombination protein RAD52